MSLAVYVNQAQTVIPNTVCFYTANNTLTDPATVTAVVTDPNGNETSYTYTSAVSGLNVIYKTAVGKYELDLQPFNTSSPPAAGLWHVVWVGVGATVASTVQVTNQSFRVNGLAGVGSQQTWYASVEELKDRLGASYSALAAQQGVNSQYFNLTNDDYQLNLALEVASKAVNRFCGTHFNKITEARTYVPMSIYHLHVDQLVKGSITAFNLDVDGDGIFETPWTENLNYQMLIEGEDYNINRYGAPRPQDFVRVILGTPTTPGGGQFFPFVWPFTHMDRVQIFATWGWPEIPSEVTEATLLLATDYFMSKNAPFGIAGVSDIGQVRVQQSPWVVDLLRPYLWMRGRVGV